MAVVEFESGRDTEGAERAEHLTFYCLGGELTIKWSRSGVRRAFDAFLSASGGRVFQCIQGAKCKAAAYEVLTLSCFANCACFCPNDGIAHLSAAPRKHATTQPRDCGVN